MLNLMKKDIILQKHLLLVYLGLILLYLYVDINYVVSVVMTSSLFVLHSHYYDEKDKANMLLNSLPYTRKEIVSSKYIEAILILIPVIAISVLGNTIMNGGELTVTFTSLFACIIGTMMFTAFYLPFTYKFSQQYLMIATSFLIGLVIVFMPAINRFVMTKFSTQINDLKSVSDVQLIGVIGVISILIYAVSWKMSISIYSKKSF